VATKKGTTKKEFTFKYHLFCERHPIPKNIKHKIKADGTLSDEISTEIGGDVARIIQSSVIMDEGTAIAIRDWLNDRIKFLESLRHKDKKGSKEQIQKTGKK